MLPWILTVPVLAMLFCVPAPAWCQRAGVKSQGSWDSSCTPKVVGTPLHLLIFMDFQVQRTPSASTLVSSPVSCPASPGAAGLEKTPKLLPKFVKPMSSS